MSEEWAPPKATVDSTAAAEAGPSGHFYDLGVLAKVVTGLLIASVSLNTILALFEMFAYASRLEDTELGLLIVGLFLMLVGFAALAILVVNLPLWVLFHYRAAKNLRALGHTGLVHTPAAQVYWWFVPIANLFMPFGATAELIRASESQDDSWVFTPKPSSMAFWWALHIGAKILSGISSRLVFIEGMEYWGAVLNLLYLPLLIGSTVLYVGYLHRICNGQRRQRERQLKATASSTP